MTKQYIQPQVAVVRIMNAGLMQAVSPTPAGDTMGVKTGIETNDQW